MKIHPCIVYRFSCLSLPLLLLTGYGNAASKGKYVCAEPNPAQLCTPANTCGSASTPCTIDIKRSGGSSASAVPSIAGVKRTALFCVASGTTMTWQSSSKNTGFVIDFGATTPFDGSDAIVGGADRPISVVAKKPGCYKYSAGACTPGTIYGMCGSTDTEVVVTGAK